MLRKTGAAGGRAGGLRAASMRPQRNAAENVERWVTVTTDHLLQ